MIAAPPTPSPAKRVSSERFVGMVVWSAISPFVLLSLFSVLILLAVSPSTNIRKKTNETSAINSLKAISAAESRYKEMYPQAGYSCDLAALGGDPAPGAPTPTTARLLDPDLATTAMKSGYVFTVLECTKTAEDQRITGYRASATPLTVRKTGDRGFCLNEQGAITFDPTGGIDCTQPLR